MVKVEDSNIPLVIDKLVRKQTDYYIKFLEEKEKRKVLQKELTIYRKYGHIVRAIKYILAYSERLDYNNLLEKIKTQLK